MAEIPRLSDIPEEIMIPLYAAVGQLTIAWGQIDASLSLISNTIYHTLGGRDVEKELPRMLKRKLRFLRLCANRIDALKPFRAKLLGLVRRVEYHAKIRNDVVHGFLSGFEPDTQYVVFTNIDAQKNIHIAHRMRGTVLDLARAGTIAVDIAGALTDLGTAITDSFLPDDGN